MKKISRLVLLWLRTIFWYVLLRFRTKFWGLYCYYCKRNVGARISWVIHIWLKLVYMIQDFFPICMNYALCSCIMHGSCRIWFWVFWFSMKRGYIPCFTACTLVGNTSRVDLICSNISSFGHAWCVKLKAHSQNLIYWACSANMFVNLHNLSQVWCNVLPPPHHSAIFWFQNQDNWYQGSPLPHYSAIFRFQTKTIPPISPFSSQCLQSLTKISRDALDKFVELFKKIVCM